MSRYSFDARTRLSIRFALTADHRTPWHDARLEAEARAIGMCGAEIDVARQGRSFDVVTGHAIALATAAGCDRHEARQRAIKAGISAEDCDVIETFAAKDGTATARPEDANG